MPEIHQHRFESGLVLLAQVYPDARSLSLTCRLPAGVASEPADRSGLAPLLAEMIFRGAGDLDARAHSDELDRLGVRRSASARRESTRFSATMLAENVDEALPRLLDMLCAPRLEEAALEPARELGRQAIAGLADQPQQRVGHHLMRRCEPAPFDRSVVGTLPGLEAIDLADVQSFHRSNYVPDGSVLAVAGHLDFAALKDQVGQCLADWSGSATVPEAQSRAPQGYEHETADTAQAHIGVAYDAPPAPDDQAALQRTAVAVLSGGMSGRLFTEVREKRGLCYSVYARYAGRRDRGHVLAQAGTTVDRAQETLDVLVGELRRLSDGVDEDEFERARTGLKSRLVMEGESTGARASALAGDWHLYGRPRTLAERAEEIEAVKLDQLRAYLAGHRPAAMTAVTIGPKPLDASAALADTATEEATS
ncbi:MAG: pitrilysin family protein [Phycisphaeraceae bacterium]|nr:pitrilysin family protein [Phycisphaeraceae bacterium]